MKRLPIGMENYLDAIRTYYVDKTMIIKDAIDFFSYRTVLITRPRRFGKSLTLSMMEHFFTNKGDYRFAFEGKKIMDAGEGYLAYMNAYPVVHLNMKNIVGDNFQELLFETKKALSSLYEAFPELEDSKQISEQKKRQFLSIKNQEADESKPYEGALQLLIDLLYAHYGKRVIVLIDEYDNPINEAYQKGFGNTAISFFSSLYLSALKGDSHLYFGLMTGVLEISKESIFSELNNVDVYSVADSELSSYFGFTAEEVQALFSSYDLPCPMDELRRYYGGYGGGEEKVFNPWSILNYANRQQFLPYWLNTDSNYFVSSALRSSEDVLNSLNRLLNNPSAPFNFVRGISFRDLSKNDDILFSLLVHAGYLSVSFSQETSSYTLTVPNLEARSVFAKEIVARNQTQEIPLKAAIALKEALYRKDLSQIQEAFERIFFSYSYYDLTSEKDYQNIVTGILALLFDECIVKPEVNNRLGRCDIMISPKKEGELGIIVEIKKAKGRASEAKQKEKAEIAFRQIKAHRYYDELEKRGCLPIFLYVFIVFENRFYADCIDAAKPK